ncbi:ATP-dependent helicase [bacterium (Candidatus Torokbacteria) CG_4_10_14_0_2_um_filter_35_8]|nr:MAG: ATP-dependent helicase [bacterium (Candidatus Torokbacteria) CG_4_10_14_0_2_um_filter_35_8]
MNNQRTPVRWARRRSTQNTRFGHSKRNGRFRGGHSRFAARRGRPKLDISSFINKAVAPPAPEEVFVPEHSFADFELNSILLRSIGQKGYVQPTPIQDKIIPSILCRKDVVGLSNTGTGKTAAFLIPLIEKVLQNPHEQILIVTPTRELALQIEQELQSITRHMRVYSVTCVGGEHIGMQIRKLRYKSNFIIGTPGRLIDLVKRGILILNGVCTVVLDEADRMLDMGFVNDIRLLMARVSEERQTLCFAATMPKKIEALINDFLKNPSIISVKTVEIPENIEQDIVRVRDLNKVDVLHNLLQNNEFKKVLVFGRTKRGVENLSRILTRRGVKVESIHSDKTQAQRKRALLNFKKNRVQALVATDVAARGLHIDDVTHVINYEIPETYDDYIHRVGRTGRGTQRGKALTFVN